MQDLSDKTMHLYDQWTLGTTWYCNIFLAPVGRRNQCSEKVCMHVCICMNLNVYWIIWFDDAYSTEYIYIGSCDLLP